jgi:hypothetical protein
VSQLSSPLHQGPHALWCLDPHAFRLQEGHGGVFWVAEGLVRWPLGEARSRRAPLAWPGAAGPKFLTDGGLLRGKGRGRRSGSRTKLHGTDKNPPAAAGPDNCCNTSCTFDPAATPISVPYETTTLGDLELKVPKPMFTADFSLNVNVSKACCVRDADRLSKRYALVTMADNGYMLPLVAMLQSFVDTNPW